MRKKRTDGRTGFRKRILAGGLSLAAALCLASCGAENGAESTGAVGVQEKQQVRPGEEAARQEETQPAIVDGVQLAAGYGIFSAGQPQVYVMKKEPEPIETDGAKAWLLSSIYQDGLFRLLVMVEDRSVTEISREEAEKLEVKDEDQEMQIKRMGEN
jgi:hypothetical protein